MKLTVKVLGGTASNEFSFEVDGQSNVKVFKDMVSKRLNTTSDQLKLVFKGRTMSDEKLLSDYKISENAKLHAVVKKQPKGEQVALPKQPQYSPDEFWKKLEEVLMNQYDPNTTHNIMSQFRKDYDHMLTTMSLDDIERIAKRKLTG